MAEHCSQRSAAESRSIAGVDTFTDDDEVIESAADRQMTHVRSFQAGKHAELSQKLLNELSTAKLRLLNREKKAAYDRALRETPTPRPATPLPRAKPLPAAARSMQPDARPDEASSFDISVAGQTSAPSRSAARPFWQQPAVLAAGVVVLLVVGTLVMLIGGGDPKSRDDATQTVANEIPRKSASAGGVIPPDAPSSDPLPRPDKRPVPDSPSKSVSPPGSSPDAPPQQPAEMVDGKALDLIARIDPRRDVTQGEWQLANHELTSPAAAGRFDCVAIPVVFPVEYRIVSQVVRTQGDGSVYLQFFVDGRICTLIVDDFGIVPIWMCQRENQRAIGFGCLGFSAEPRPGMELITKKWKREIVTVAGISPANCQWRSIRGQKTDEVRLECVVLGEVVVSVDENAEIVAAAVFGVYEPELVTKRSMLWIVQRQFDDA